MLYLVVYAGILLVSARYKFILAHAVLGTHVLMVVLCNTTHNILRPPLCFLEPIISVQLDACYDRGIPFFGENKFLNGGAP